MESSGVVAFNDQVNILGQQPLAKVNSPLVFCFPVADNSYTAVLDVLRHGLSRLSLHFPWVAGQLFNEGSSSRNSGTFKIAPLDDTPRLTIKDLRHDPSFAFDTLQKIHFPASMLDEAVLSPCKTLPGSPSEISPVLLLQANLVNGGLLLTIAGQHNTMDMTGQGHVIHLLSKACHNEPFTSDEVRIGNLNRHGIIPLLDSYEPGPEVALQVGTPLSSLASSDCLVHPSPSRPGGYPWATFTFSASSLARLKALASKTRTTAYISTDDVLTALIWQSVLRARSRRIEFTQTVHLFRAVDVRSFLDIPQTYLGFMQNGTYQSSAIQNEIAKPLGSVASQLRSAIDPPSSITYNTRAYATLLHRSPDKTAFSFLKGLDLAEDLLITSWVKLNSYDLDFNLGLGKPMAVRRGRFPPVEGLVFLLPKSLDGEIAVGLCLRSDDMQRLKVDEMLTEYAVYRG